MKENVVIHNYDYDIDDSVHDLKPVVLGFLREKMKISPDPREVYVAHRLGENSIVAKVNHSLKNDIFENIKVLKDEKNSEGHPIYVTEQQPEGFRARRKDAHTLADEYKEKNKGTRIHSTATITNFQCLCPTTLYRISWQSRKVSVLQVYVKSCLGIYRIWT